MKSDNGPLFVHSARPNLPVERVAAILQAEWGISGELADVGGDRDQNLVVTTPAGTSWLVKIGQPGEVHGVLDMQLAALRHAAHQDPGLGIPPVIPKCDGEYLHALPADGGGAGWLRVFGYVAGKPIGTRPRPAALLRGVGGTMARLDRALAGFFHPYAGHDLLWDVRQIPALRPCALDIDDARQRDRILQIFDEFTEHVLPRLGGLRSQVIHGDATAENVLVADDRSAIAGIIDFGDVMHGPLVQELAVAMADTTSGLDTPWQGASHVAAGFDERLPLEDEELALLWDLARARLALTVSVLASRTVHRAEGAGSMESDMTAYQDQLKAFDAVGHNRAFRDLRRTLRLPEPMAVTGSGTDTETDRLVARREERLMPGLALFYPEAPLHAVRGEGMWLFDADGTPHLDCYNNVPHVGHCHPHVGNAVARQTRTLNTNTRYLYDSVLEYADRLAERFPGELGSVMFVNSGSEANDLAWRMARAWSGQGGALVTAGAYHGVTEAIAALSPYEAGNGAPHPHVAWISPPGGAAQASSRGDGGYAVDIDRAIDRLAASGYGVAATMIDPTLASDGILDAPAGWLNTVFARVRGAGGLCIADEVQAGFGRLGTAWGFEAHGAVPDIVTLGKPAANGYPLGAVVTTPAIMRVFAERTDFFSTFGGNPVACNAGLAVLDVLDREGLWAAAAEVGGYLRDRLAALGTRHETIGEVRGRGLFLGVELVTDRDSRQPAPKATARVALAMRRAGVLVGVEGPHANVLKIRPPIVCKHTHADLLVDALDRALESG
ncbi:aminotransferase class III-fold pyridoxal phosphate-dependent enzyme [Halofilum ochraceum]|uniref:aminotransferase class III-fold pyridoxal phosphate-dependent enzyme n=1 Tax=Halofilum ochraceum TaxID=1611323 RepID=UPI0009F36AE4|nr:aminotransferase class III-fold pyridoxal phosphate-dependent enzyme [Halofilum ochraceum]